jgi:hypothetical protein
VRGAGSNTARHVIDMAVRDARSPAGPQAGRSIAVLTCIPIRAMAVRPVRPLIADPMVAPVVVPVWIPACRPLGDHAWSFIGYPISPLACS